MRAGYSVKRVKDICDKGSSNVAQKDLEGHDGDYPIYGASGFIKNVDFFHQDREYVGIVKDGSGIGRVAFYPPKSSLIGTLQYIFPKAEYDIRYVGYCLQSLNLASYRQGAAIPHIYFRDYGEREVLVADSITEQQRIVGILDREFAQIDAMKANAVQSLQAARDLFQATLKKELEPKEGWQKKRLDEICCITAELIDPTLPEYLNQTHIGGANIVAETGVLIDLKTSKEENLISGKFPFDETMVLYSKIRPYLKKVCCPDFKGICSADIYPLKPNPGYDRTFLYYILLSNDFTDYAILGSARAGMPKVNRPYMFAYSCFIPEYDEQRTIADRLNAVREQTYSLQENYQKTLTLCDDLKLSLLRKAFNGEL